MNGISDLMRSAVVGVLLVIAGAIPGWAQPVPDSTQTDTIATATRLESMFDSFGADEQASSRLSEQFASLAENPLDLNTASTSELSTLPGLSSGQAHRIVQFRTREGAFAEVNGLHSVEGISIQTVQSIRPFLIVDSSTENFGSVPFPSFSTITSNLELEISQRYTRGLELGRGFRENRFLGPPGRFTSRILLHFKRRIQIGLTLDKDPGEPVRWAPATDTYGFDHVAGSAALRDLGILETLVLGDFSAQFGQGVALWQGIRFGKGRDPVGPILRSGRGLLPYRSASETGYFRGAGATFDLPGNVFLTAFASHRQRDASPDSLFSPENPSEPIVLTRTISAGGRHRTSSELARKGTFGETVFGGALEYRSPSFHAGVVGYRARFDLPLRPENRPYRQFRPSGRRTFMTSAYATGYLSDYILFGEIAFAPNGNMGGMAGAALDQGDALQAVVVGRYYPSNFPNFHGNSFGERGTPQNEIGFYTGLQLQVARNWQIQAYYDQFRSPWLRYNVPLPSSGSEARVVFTYTPRPWLSTYLQGKVQREDVSTTHVGPGRRRLEGLGRERRYTTRLHTEYSFSDALSLRTRLEFSHYFGPETSANGIFLSQGFRLTPYPSFQIDTQIALFDTDGYAARIYAYERDLRYSFSVPVFFDKGRRSYILVRYDVGSSWTLEAKYGVTRYAHRSTIGSGLSQIDGTRRREIGIQIQWEL